MEEKVETKTFIWKTRKKWDIIDGKLRITPSRTLRLTCKVYIDKNGREWMDFTDVKNVERVEED